MLVTRQVMKKGRMLRVLWKVKDPSMPGKGREIHGLGFEFGR